MRKAIATVLVGLLLVVMAALPASAACPLTSLFRMGPSGSCAGGSWLTGLFGNSGSSGSCAGGSCLTNLFGNGCSTSQCDQATGGNCGTANGCGITRVFDLLSKCGR